MTKYTGGLVSIHFTTISNSSVQLGKYPFLNVRLALLSRTLSSGAKAQTQALNIPIKVPLGGGRHAELTEWNGSKRVDLRFWETDTIPTRHGVSLSLSQWKVLCSATQVMDDLISRAKDGEPVDWRFHLGEDVYVIIKAPQLTIHIRKHLMENGHCILRREE